MTLAWRNRCLLLFLIAGLVGVAVRLIHLQLSEAPALQAEVRDQSFHTVEMPAIRGAILDRNGEPLAVSTPVKSVYATPDQVLLDRARLRRLAALLAMDRDRLRRRLDSASPFVYLKRQVPPELGQQVEQLGLSGIGTVREYRRYYPTAEVAAHPVGFVGIDSQGLEGVELAYDDHLGGQAGRRLVVRDALGRDIRTLRIQRPVRMGQRLRLSLDARIQYIAYRAIKEAVDRYQARAGMAVVLDARTGEVRAMANVPSYNPNNLEETEPEQRRNRAVTDAFEPGSVFKPFIVAAALEAGVVEPDTRIFCENGVMKVANRRIHDSHPMGQLSVRQVIQKSSNIGAAKIALELEDTHLWHTLKGFGFGIQPGTSFPGETPGVLHLPYRWRTIDRAILGFGHGVAASALQIARAYAVLANGGIRRPVTLKRLEPNEALEETRVLSEQTAHQVTAMLEMVTTPEGTGEQATIPGYQVAGKTGTAQKPRGGGYLEGKYVASFAGFAPVDKPRLVAVVMIDEPRQEHYGGIVAAPVFQRILSRSLRLLQVPPHPLKKSSSPPLPLQRVRDHQSPKPAHRKTQDWTHDAEKPPT